MSPRPLPRRARPGTLRDRIFRVLARTTVPLSTVEIQLCCAIDLPNGVVRVYQCLIKEELFGRVARVAPCTLPDPAGARPGRRSVRWVLTELGQLVIRAR